MSSLLDEAVTGLNTATSERHSRASLVTTIALSLIAAQLAFRAWAVFGGWFYGDDLTFLSDVALGKNDLSWYFQKYDLQFMPVGLSLAALVGKAGTFAWMAAASELIVFQALASLGCWWMLRTVFGNRPLILAPLAFYLFSAISMPALMWWAAGLNMIVVQPAVFAAITLHILYVRGGKRRYALLAASAFGIALLCYVKALLIPLVLVVVTLSYFSTGRAPTRALDTFRRFFLAWALYAVIGGTYLGLYLTHRSPTANHGSPIDYPNLINHMVFSNLASGMLGGPWKWSWFGPGLGPRLMADPISLAVMASLLVIILSISLAASTYRGALKPLWFVGPYVVASIAIIAGSRAGAFGAGVWSEIRYWTDFMPFLALAIGLMCMPVLGARDPLAKRGTPLMAITFPIWTGPLLGIAFIASALFSSVAYVRPWHDNFETRRFVNQATAELQVARTPVQIADQAVPDGVVNAFSFPYNLPSRLLAPVGGHFTTPRFGNDLRTFDGQGHLVPGKVGAGIAAPSASLTSCVVGTPDTRASTYKLGAKTVDYPFWLSVSYRSTDSGSVTVVAGANRQQGWVNRGRHTLFMRTEGRYKAVSLTVGAGVTMCVDAINVGPNIEAGP